MRQKTWGWIYQLGTWEVDGLMRQRIRILWRVGIHLALGCRVYFMEIYLKSEGFFEEIFCYFSIVEL